MALFMLVRPAGHSNKKALHHCKALHLTPHLDSNQGYAE
jgi:hypothetical protein